MKTPLQRLIDGPEDDCQKDAVAQHFCRDRGKCACMGEVVEGVRARIDKLEIALHTIVGHGNITVERAKQVAEEALKP